MSVLIILFLPFLLIGVAAVGYIIGVQRANKFWLEEIDKQNIVNIFKGE